MTATDNHRFMVTILVSLCCQRAHKSFFPFVYAVVIIFFKIKNSLQFIRQTCKKSHISLYINSSLYVFSLYKSLNFIWFAWNLLHIRFRKWKRSLSTSKLLQQYLSHFSMTFNDLTLYKSLFLNFLIQSIFSCCHISKKKLLNNVKK